MSKTKDLLSISVADSLGAGLGAVFWFILATVISPEKFGEIHYFLGIAGLAYGLSLIGSSDVISVYVAKKIQIQSTLSLLSLIIGGVSAIVIEDKTGLKKATPPIFQSGSDDGQPLLLPTTRVKDQKLALQKQCSSYLFILVGWLLCVWATCVHTSK